MHMRCSFTNCAEGEKEQTLQFLREQGAQNIEAGRCRGSGCPEYDFDLYVEGEDDDILAAVRIMLYAMDRPVEQLRDWQPELPAAPARG